VGKEEVEALMLRYFPKCPLCGADKGYEVSGFAKQYVQCKSCGAKWESTDFIKCKELEKLTLWEPADDGKGESLKLKKFPVEFWQDSEAIRNEERKIAEKESAKLETKAEQFREKLIFHPEMTQKELSTLIERSLEEITHWDYGSTSEGVWGPILGNTSSADATTIRLLRAIFEQNKILIIQNELLRRALTETKTNAKP